MKLRVEHYTDPEGVAIEYGVSKKPIFVIPFPKDRFHRAEIVDAGTVLFVGSRRAQDRRNELLLSVYDLRANRFSRHAEVPDIKRLHHRLSRDRNRLFVVGNGLSIIDLHSLTRLKHYECYKVDSDNGRAASYANWTGGYMDASQQGWKHIVVRHDYYFGEVRDGEILLVQGMEPRHPSAEPPEVQQALTIDTDSDQVHARILRDANGNGPLSGIDPRAELAFIDSRQTGVFRAFVPLPPNAGPEGVLQARAGTTEAAKSGEPRYGLSVHLWPLADADASPMTVVVRSEPASHWKRGLEIGHFYDTDATVARDRALHMLDALPSAPNLQDEASWSLAAHAFIHEIIESPSDGTIWISFADDCLRSLDRNGRLGPLIRLAGEPSRMYGPGFTHEGDGTISVHRFIESGSLPGLARYRFDPRQFDGVAGPISIEPLAPETPVHRYEKAFAAFVRRQTRKRFTVPDWTRESCAAALQKQTKLLRNGFGDMVPASTERLNFTYRVGRSTMDEASFFAGLVERNVPVVHELRALLNTYLEVLGDGGEGVQPWEDPDNGIGALGSALHALAILDPDALDVVRVYLEKRDGEHEGYCWDAVLPAYFNRHGWQNAETVRFGIYAVLNRFWGGAHPYDLEGLREAMEKLTTPPDVAVTVRREADAFGRKPEWDYDAATYRAAFCALLDPAVNFEAAVLDGLKE